MWDIYINKSDYYLLYYKMNLIVAHCRNKGIGFNNMLPWKLSADMERFKKITIGNGNNAVIMGRNTWKSLPSNYKPLPKRDNIVLTTRTPSISETPTIPTFMPSLQDTMKYCENKKVDNIWVIGGERLYRDVLNSGNVKYIYLTRIDTDFECDAFFPNIPFYFRLKSKTPWMYENNIKYKFEKYEAVDESMWGSLITI
jgi:dihydrofolate reductase